MLVSIHPSHHIALRFVHHFQVNRILQETFDEIDASESQEASFLTSSKVVGSHPLSGLKSSADRRLQTNLLCSHYLIKSH